MPENPHVYVQLEAIGVALTDLIRAVSYGQDVGKTVDDLLRLKDMLNRAKGMVC